jgi:carbon storage regulator
MLVVTRLLDQKIIIGENAEIVLTVVDIQGNKVRLGIEADKSVPIFREEVYEKMKESEGV